MIRKASVDDASSIVEIYNYYIANSVATFTENEMSIEEMKRLMTPFIDNFPWLVFVENQLIIGYAYAGPWKARDAYRQTVETSVYLRDGYTGKGVGYVLYRDLINRLRMMNIHAVIGGISLPNEASQQLHEKLGYTKVAHFKEVGNKFGKWVDVGYWELILSDCC